MFLARPERFELPTPWFVAKYSIQMSYGRFRGAHYTQTAEKIDGLGAKSGQSHTQMS